MKIATIRKCIAALALSAAAFVLAYADGVTGGGGSTDTFYVTCPPVACVNGKIYICSDTSAVYKGRGGNCEVMSDPNGNFLPIPGGTMTGGITTKTGSDVITLPTYSSGTTDVSSLRFNTRGIEPYPWRIFSNGAVPFDFAGDHDHPLIFAYNLTWDPTNGLTRDSANSHAIRLGYETRYTVLDPNTNRGSFEFNIDIDPNLGTTTWTSTPVRPFFLGYAMDSPRNTVFTIGDPGSNPDPNDETSLTLNVGGKCGFCYYTGDIANHGDSIEFGAVRVMGDGSLSGRGSVTTQGRIVLDPGDSKDYSTDRAVLIRNFVNGNLGIYAGKDGSGVTQTTYIGDDARASNIRIGNSFDGSRFTVKGITDVIQTVIKSNSSQDNDIFQVQGTSGTVMSVANWGTRAGAAVRIGNTQSFNKGLLQVEADADNVQFYVKGNGTQTNPVVKIEKSDASSIMAISNLGVITGTVTANWNTDTKCINVDPTSTTTNWLFWRTTKAITVTSIDCIVDAATSVVMTLQECNANGGACTDTESAITCGTTNTQVAGGSIDDAAIDATDWIRVTRGTVSGSPAQVSLCMTYTTP